jgi:hypothetical protein
MPNGTSIQSPHTSNLLLSAFPRQARKAHLLPGLLHNSLIYVGKLCDSGCYVMFTREKVEVAKDGQCVMLGLRDPKSRLCRVSLKDSMKPVRKATFNQAHDNSNHTYLIKYLYAACFSPVKSTWIQAIKNGNYTSWPGLMKKAVEKRVSKSTATVKGHLNQQ